MRIDKFIATAFMEEMDWDKTYDDVRKHNPKIAQIINKLNPGKDHTLFRAIYPYAHKIQDEGEFLLPGHPDEHCKRRKVILEKLGYSGCIPLGLILKNAIEVFIDLKYNMIPSQGMLYPGDFLGLSNLNINNREHTKFMWNITSGARSIFLLPGISETEKYYRLKKHLDLIGNTPKHITDHWSIFNQITNHPNFPDNWHCEILFFSKKWFSHYKDPVWQEFYNYLISVATERNELTQNYFLWDIIFKIINAQNNIKLSPYIMDTAKHLFLVASGKLSGFAPAINDIHGPIKALQEVYINIYNLRDYVPTIMHPHHFSLEDTAARPVYYSLQFPNALITSPKSRKRNSTITDLYEVKSLMNKYILELKKNDFKIEDSKLYKIIKEGLFEYFHTNIKKYHGIKNSNELSEQDAGFSQMQFDSSNKKLAMNSAFFKGCIRISRCKKK